MKIKIGVHRSKYGMMRNMLRYMFDFMVNGKGSHLELVGHVAKYPLTDSKKFRAYLLLKNHIEELRGNPQASQAYISDLEKKKKLLEKGAVKKTRVSVSRKKLEKSLSKIIGGFDEERLKSVEFQHPVQYQEFFEKITNRKYNTL